MGGWLAAATRHGSANPKPNCKESRFAAVRTGRTGSGLPLILQHSWTPCHAFAGYHGASSLSGFAADYSGSRYGGGRDQEEIGLAGASGFGHSTAGNMMRRGPWPGWLPQPQHAAAACHPDGCRHSMPCHGIPWASACCSAVLRHPMPCHAMPCHAAHASCHDMAAHVYSGMQADVRLSPPQSTFLWPTLSNVLQTLARTAIRPTPAAWLPMQTPATAAGWATWGRRARAQGEPAEHAQHWTRHLGHACRQMKCSNAHR